MKKLLSVMVTIVFAGLLLVGCSDKPSEPQPKAEEAAKAPPVPSIKISYVKLPLNVPSIVEKKQNLFEKEFANDGIQVVFPEITEGPKMTAALAAGSLDFCNALGGTSAILAAANGVDLKIIGMYSRAPKAFTIMVKNPQIKSVADLKGKKVAGPKGTILHQLLLASLQQNNLKQEEVEYINMPIPSAVSAMQAGNVDAALIAGPAVPQALESGARILTTGEGLLDATIVIAVSGDFLKNHPDLVKRYLQVHQASLQYMQENPDEVYQLAAEETGISIGEVKQMYDWYDFNPTITDKDLVDLEKTQEFLLQNEMLTNKIDIKGLIADI